ncbi:flagellar export protein FliJ [Legionella jordanis]|uniref:flagellar export protein FliJ n=1 Tax=Legionella jordanis TaxID=456 RepID=UPI000F00EDF5|nr:flagellar export protein FliJ [Legionella jordanis]RMX15276.1 flagellar export protein FliJ [Legionella jordanis]
MDAQKTRLMRLLGIKEQTTKLALGNLVRAREQFIAGKMQHEKLLEYRREYLEQLNSLGNEGCKVAHIRNRLDFINQLDRALGQIAQQLAHLAKQRTNCEQLYFRAKSEEDVVKSLLEKLEKREKMKENRRNQKENDEYAQKQWYSKSSMINSNKRGE